MSYLSKFLERILLNLYVLGDILKKCYIFSAGVHNKGDKKMIAVAVLIFSGCFAKILIIILYSILLDDSAHMADSNSELIKQIKLRYTNQIKLELPIQDAEKFVSRYIYQYSKIIKFSNILDMLSLIVMLAGIAINYEKQYFGTEVLFIAMFIYLSVGLLVASNKKERIIINNIADYLVNNMNTRMIAREHREMVKEDIRKNVMTAFDDEKTAKAEIMPAQQIDKSEPVKALKSDSEQDNAIIEAVLKEFFA